MAGSRRRRWVIVLAVVVPLLAVGGFLLGRSLWWSLRPTPEFAPLSEQPDTARRGTIAYVQAYPNDGCIWVARAAGGAARRVGCVEGSANALQWRDDGRLEGTRFARSAKGGSEYRWIADVAAGTISDIPGSQRPPSKTGTDADPVGPNGERVTFTSSRGRLIVTLKDGATTRTLISVAAPDTYTFGQTAWSPDGEYFVVHDDLDRVLLVTTMDDARALFVGKGWGPAVTKAEPLGPVP